MHRHNRYRKRKTGKSWEPEHLRFPEGRERVIIHRLLLCNLFLSMYDELPAPKKKTPPPKNSDKKPLAMSFIPTAKGFVYNMDLFVAQPPVIIL